MSFERDEMFRLMSARLNDWRQMSRSVISLAGQANAGIATKAKDLKAGNADQAAKKTDKPVKKPQTIVEDTTVPGEKKNMS